MWIDLDEPWKRAFLMGWEAFINGSIPIGAVIADQTGVIVSEGRNRIFESGIPNPKIAHAEIECLQHLDMVRHPNTEHYTLYTNMEPCPMCFGTIVMSTIRNVKIAARDSYCGATHYAQLIPYIQSKNIQIEFILGDLQAVQYTLQAYFELRARKGETSTFLEVFQKDCPEAVRFALELYQELYLDTCVQKCMPFSEVFDSILKRLRKTNHPV